MADDPPVGCRTRRVEIALHSFIVAEPILTILMAALWLGAGVFWTRRGGRGGPWAVLALSAFEVVVSLLFTEEVTDEAVAPWIVAIHLVLIAAAIAAAAMTIVRDRPADVQRAV